jgi:CheY-like chemotaxis protein
MEEALSEGGFEAALAASGEEAITLLEADKSSFRGVVTDIKSAG